MFQALEAHDEQGVHLHVHETHTWWKGQTRKQTQAVQCDVYCDRASLEKGQLTQLGDGQETNLRKLK